MEIGHTAGRFYTKTGSGEAELLYRMTDQKTMSIYHTFVPEEARGKGVAEQLALEAFSYAKEKGLKVRPDCPYITYFLEKHKELCDMSV